MCMSNDWHQSLRLSGNKAPRESEVFHARQWLDADGSTVCEDVEVNA